MLAPAAPVPLPWDPAIFAAGCRMNDVARMDLIKAAFVNPHFVGYLREGWVWGWLLCQQAR